MRIINIFYITGLGWMGCRRSSHATPQADPSPKVDAPQAPVGSTAPRNDNARRNLSGVRAPIRQQQTWNNVDLKNPPVGIPTEALQAIQRMTPLGEAFMQKYVSGSTEGKCIRDTLKESLEPAVTMEIRQRDDGDIVLKILDTESPDHLVEFIHKSPSRCVTKFNKLAVVMFAQSLLKHFKEYVAQMEKRMRIESRFPDKFRASISLLSE